jgi:hypothetical protein
MSVTFDKDFSVHTLVCICIPLLCIESKIYRCSDYRKNRVLNCMYVHMYNLDHIELKIFF